MNTLLDKYFNRPVFWDYMLSSVIGILAYLSVEYFSWIKIPNPETMFAVSTDLATIGLTCAGFLITLLTVLITFKTGSTITQKSDTNKKSIFELFFASDLYFQTVKHFKNGIKSLLFISVIGYLLKILMPKTLHEYLFYYNLPSLGIIVLTLWRATLILSQVLKMQKEVVDL